MENPIHTLNSLFDQLGLDSSSIKIAEFIDQHSPLDSNTELHKAPFWNQSQSNFLKEMKDNDGDWSVLIDQLDNSLR